MTPLAMAAVAIATAVVVWWTPGWAHLAFLTLVSGSAVTLAARAGSAADATVWLVLAMSLGFWVPMRQRRSRLGRSKRPAPGSAGLGSVAAQAARVDTPAPMAGKSAFDPGLDGIEVPGYEVLEKVGSGGMASVYRAVRKQDGKIVALKVPMEQYVADAKFIRRFHREAEVAQRLDHPNIVRTYDHGAQGAQHFMSMEFVDGRSLEGIIDENDHDLALVVDVMKRVADALQAIHSAGIVHRDIKPGNIMIVKDGVRDGRPRVAEDAVKLMDFGIAGGKVMTRLTMTGARIGTPVYMSPEQARGLKIDHRSDIYSLGLVMYELLTGETAFKGGYEAIVHQQIFQTPAPPRQLDVSIPRSIDALVMRMVAKDPQDRPTLADVIDVLGDESDWGTTDVDLPTKLMFGVAAKQGVVRVMDPEGSLHVTFGDVGVAPGSFPSTPVSLAYDPTTSTTLLGLFEYRVGSSDDQRMVFRVSSEGEQIDSFGSYGMQPDQLLHPTAIAVAPDGDVFVLDGEAVKIVRFGADGSAKGSFGGPGDGKGTFDDPRQIQVGPDGKVYVLDYGNRQVQRFTPDGTYETRWAFRMPEGEEGMRVLDGFHVGPDGTVFIGDGTAGRVRAVLPGGRVGQSYVLEAKTGESTEGLIDIGVDGEGKLYVARRGSHYVRRYGKDGRVEATLETYAPLVQLTIVERPTSSAVPATA